MNNNSWFKKEMPLQTVIGFGGGATGFSAHSSSATKVYVDDVFSTDVYTGNGGAHQITNNIDNTGKGGLVWMKNRERSSSADFLLFDTVRGATKYLTSTTSVAEATSGGGTGINTFNEDGYTLQGNGYGSNYNGEDFVAWNLREQKGFFDIVTFTGNGSVRTISHGLGSVPGMIMIKNRTSVNSWFTYHRDLGPSAYVMLNHNNAVATGHSWFMNDTAPTATEFTLGTGGNVNASGDEFIVYVFAGGKGTTDKAVEFDGDDYLSMPVSNTDFDWGASDSLTIECFLNLDDVSSQNYNSIINRWDGSNYSFGLDVKYNGNLFFYFGSGTGSINTTESSGTTIGTNTWYHVAIVKDGTTGRFFIDGKACGTFTWNLASSNSSQPLHVGNLADSNAYPIDGELSNVRMTIGQALYKTDFNVPHDPLTTTSQGANSSNVKLLCCNQSTTTGSTVAPGTITANGNPTVTTNSSIFDDTEAYVFGEDSEGIVKCGSYIGDGTTDGSHEIHLGWEPQLILLKESSNSGNNWSIWDSMRGIVTGGNDALLEPNTSSVEWDGANYIALTSNGFKLESDSNNVDGRTMIYMAFRRPDGYVGKPAEAGTDVFALAIGGSDNVKPTFETGFPVDFNFYRLPASTSSWVTSARLIGKSILYTDSTGAQQTTSAYEWNFNNGMGNWTGDQSAYQSWNWKRGAGFDVVTYTGDYVAGRQIPHGLSKTPEMIWVKSRSNSSTEWTVYHKGLNGGVNPEDYYVALSDSDAEANDLYKWNDTAPTSTHFSVGQALTVNENNYTYIAMLFSSVENISKVGSYTGTGGSHHVTVGFTPRFLWVKRADGAGSWYVVDTLRGLDSSSSSNDDTLYFNQNVAQTTGSNWVQTSNTGFSLLAAFAGVNASGSNYIYYAHA